VHKVFVLDTNVLLHDPRAIFKFDEHEVVLPIYVIEEVDRFKREMNELGRNARMLTRFIDELREEAQANLQAGVTLPSGGRLRVAVPSDVLAERNGRSADHKILQVALLERNIHPESPTVFVSMDTNLRIRADALGLRAENYDAGRVETDHLYTGFQTVSTRVEHIDLLGKRQPIPLTELPQNGLYPNACVVLTDEGNPKHTALGRVDLHNGQVTPLRVPREGAWGAV
jgi:PhoH-like ATPase